jgi:hypothetical protein
MWASGSGLAFSFSTNKGVGEMTVAPDAEPGPRSIRIYNAEGASEARLFLVGGAPELQETEPNDHFRTPQVLTQPALVNGRLEKNGDVDSYAISLGAGEWLDARLSAYVLMSKVDAVLRLVDAGGFQIAWNHDFDVLDPRLVWRSPREQTVVLQVFGFAYPANAQIELSGGASGSYRLALGRSMTNPVAPLAMEFPGSISPGDSIEGVLCAPGKNARAVAALKKGQWIEARVAAASIGSPLDPWIAIEDAAGKELARNDDAEGTRDPRLEWQVPADGDYALVAGSVTASRRDDFRFALSLRELAPDFSAALAEQMWVLKAGETNAVKVNLRRLRGFTNELAVEGRGLPEGVAAPVVKDSKGGETVLSLVAATNAGAWSGPIRIAVSDPAAGVEKFASFALTSKTEDNGVPGGYLKLAVESVEDIWLTVLPSEAKK